MNHTYHRTASQHDGAAVSSGVGGRALAGTAGLRPGLRVAQAINVPLADQVLAAWPARFQMAVLDPTADRHVAHTQLGGSFLDGQQLFLFHTADATAFCEQHNTLWGYTGSNENLYNSSTGYVFGGVR